MSVYIFPGQGSQYKGMGAELFSKFPIVVSQAEKILNYSIREICLENPEEKLNQTQYTQPALYVVNALNFYNRIHAGDNFPNYLAGHSLGEYNALLAAGVFDFITGLKLVIKRSKLMAEAKSGKMAAVIGISVDKIIQLLNDHSLNEVVVANYNSFDQSVLSGASTSIEKTEQLLINAGARVIILNVSGAFHSPMMKEAGEKFAEYLSNFKFNEPNRAVISNVDAQPYGKDVIVSKLSSQIINPVRWTDTIRYLISQNETEFIEVGPGNILTPLVENIRKKSGTYE